MSWKDRLRPASWRGVPFGVRESGRSGGRRVGVHEYPLRDSPFIEDLGRQPKRFSVDAYIVGDAYAEIRDELIRRLEEPGPGFPHKPAGTLIHPTFGRVRALCTSFREIETTGEGRMARIQIEFVEAGAELNPQSASQHIDAVDNAGASLQTQTSADFSAGAQVSGVIEEARAPFSTGALAFANRVSSLDVFGGATADVAALTDSLRQITSRVSELVSSPADLAALVFSSMDAVLDSASSVSGALAAYQALFDFPPTISGGSSFMAQATDTNARLFSSLIRTGAVVGASRAAARADFETLEDAIAARDTIAATFDELIEDASSPGVFAIELLRRELVDAVPPPGASLPRLRALELPRNRPALVLAFQLYEDPNRDVEIVARNRVRVPLRVPGNRPLTVLTR